jgi:hypothetical protein
MGGNVCHPGSNVLVESPSRVARLAWGTDLWQRRLLARGDRRKSTRPKASVDEPMSRRKAIVSSVGTMSLLEALVPLTSQAAQPASTASKAVYVGDEIPEALARIFRSYVNVLKEAIGDAFDARLAVYGVTARMPNGIPGDPAREYSSFRKNCGKFRNPGGFPGNEPYDLCEDDSGSLPCDAKVKCCRHYAYCVPYDRFPANQLDAVSSVVLSSRIVNLPEETIRGIIAHELGHAVDFHMFGKRYRLQDRPTVVATVELERRIRLIDETIDDVEYRADDIANLLLLEADGSRLCYDPKTLLQSVVKASSCQGLDDHYAHPLLRKPVKLL